MNLVLTGSSTGIGRALAERLIAQGHRVWGLARSLQADFVVRHPGSFQASRCDVGNWLQIANAADEVAAAWGQIDGLITCAGVQGEIGRTLAADLLYSGALFGLHAWLSRRVAGSERAALQAA